MKWLQAILETAEVDADQITSIITEAKKQKLIPKERFDTVNNQLKEANTTLTNVNVELETLKSSTQSSDVLKQQLQDLQTKNNKLVEDYEGKLKGMKIQDYVKGEMLKGLKDPKYFDLLYKEVDHSKLVVGEDGTVTGFDIAPIQEKYSDLFGEATPGMGSLGNPPRKDPKPDDESIGKQLAQMAKANTVKVENNPYF